MVEKPDCWFCHAEAHIFNYRYGSGTNLFAKLVKGLTRSYNTETELNKVSDNSYSHNKLLKHCGRYGLSCIHIRVHIERRKQPSERLYKLQVTNNPCRLSNIAEFETNVHVQ